jgi:hypothetical protein
MHYSGAAVALVAAMTFSLTALGETRTAISVITAPASPMAPALASNQKSNQSFDSYSTTIARYIISPPTLILGIAEIIPVTCIDKNPGMWTNPNPSLEPVFKGRPAGTVGYQRTFKAISPPGQPCAGQGPFTYSAIDFSWMAHYNQTGLGPGVAPPPCATTNPVCPTAVFQGEWTTPDGVYDVIFSFSVSVDVVRPAGETNMFVNWFYGTGAHGRWTAMLTPPTSDPTFDFTNEVVQEVFLSAIETCNSRAPGILGPASVTPNGVPAHWTVGQLFGPEGTATAPMNVYGYDFVGWQQCPIEAFRCAGVTVPYCGNTLRQLLQISSPADPPGTFADYMPLKINKLVENITGSILKGTPEATGIGIVQSQRGNDGGLHDSELVPSRLSDCSNAVITASHFFEACLLIKPK